MPRLRLALIGLALAALPATAQEMDPSFGSRAARAAQPPQAQVTTPETAPAPAPRKRAAKRQARPRAAQ